MGEVDNTAKREPTPAELAAAHPDTHPEIVARMKLVEEKLGTVESKSLPIINKLHELLTNESSWDVVCACTHFLGTVAPLYGIEKEVAELGKRVYAVHYFEIEVPK